MRMFIALSALLASTLILSACAGSANGPPVPVEPIQVPEADRLELTSDNAEFAAKLYGQLASEDDGNLFFSPWSVSAAFAMAYAGARGETAAEIADALEFGLPIDRLHPAFQSETAGLQQSGGPNEVRIANAFWADAGYPFRAEYLEMLRVHYGAQAENAAFASDPEAARGRINDWVAEQTNDRIQDLFPQGSIDALTRLVLTNAVYFKGKWEHEFDAAHTRDETFTRGDGGETKAPLMRQTEDFGYHRGEGFQILQMPYLESSLAMLIALPDEHNGLPALEAQLTGPVLREWMASAHTREVDVFIPRFELSGEFGLVPTLQSLGVKALFGAGADLSGMDGSRELFVQSVRHKAWVSVDEEGTEAAAATGMAVGLASMPEPAPVFRADHPFLFAIVDRDAGSVLFLGRMVTP